MIVMYILSLIVFGLLVGKIASFLVGEEKPGVLQDMALGLLGSLIVISLVNMFTPHRV